MDKPAPFVTSPKDAAFSPRFEYGDQAQVSVICGPDQGTSLGAGYGRLTNAEIPWTIKYDEVVTVLEGQLTVRIDGTNHVIDQGGSIWLPIGTSLTYIAQSALILYAIHPANWADAT
jgi:ethanolamine utilization protein EutQ